jgi:hypothetical protein
MTATRQPNMSNKTDYFDTMAGRVETGDTSKRAGENMVTARHIHRLPFAHRR